MKDWPEIRKEPDHPWGSTRPSENTTARPVEILKTVSLMETTTLTRKGMKRRKSDPTYRQPLLLVRQKGRVSFLYLELEE
ncbi:hypothetical protein Taro_055194 [Colocasia esculenta]|uniref:Uncharacterized protein n=1 Tax=Colocasia esculenta TaxID=4460 RepID=A0A843XS75_COLES|nr:hypothetical protein [Colocasia esculenta]